MSMRFDAVDTSDPVAAAAFLDLALSLPQIGRWKRLSHDLLQPGDGNRVLDIGCGTGADALALAYRVGPRGQVVGVDLSQYLITIAETRTAPLGLPVTFRRSDIHNLPFADAHFDATRIDRVLHFLPDPGPALRETMRVTTPGGRIVVTEPDWGTLSIVGGDPGLTALMLEVAAEQTPGARIGAVLPQHMEEAGLLSIDRRDTMLELRDYAIAATLFGLEGIASRCVHKGRVSAKGAVRWLRSLQQACARETFRASLAGVIVSGIRRAA
jgi:SAM-dependent methyltransferase